MKRRLDEVAITPSPRHILQRQVTHHIAVILIARTLPELRNACAELHVRYKALALAPTMGALHDGHLVLLAAAPPDAAVAASIFVNPLLFGPNEDLSRYPRDESGDLAKLETAGGHLVRLPDMATMYPEDHATTIDVQGPAKGWDSELCPSYFRGVATVVARLFGQVRPDIACFGGKDWQQLQVVRRMVIDLLLPVRVIGVPKMREPVLSETDLLASAFNRGEGRQRWTFGFHRQSPFWAASLARNSAFSIYSTVGRPCSGCIVEAANVSR